MAMSALFDLPGEAGKRVERIEWGLRFPKDDLLGRGRAVCPRESEQHARSTANVLEYGTRGGLVVSRTVVTYTTAWASA